MAIKLSPTPAPRGSTGWGTAPSPEPSQEPGAVLGRETDAQGTFFRRRTVPVSTPALQDMNGKRR